LTHGVELTDGPARFEEIVESGGAGINRWYHVVIMEGRQREVRRLWEAVGATVNRLKRVRYGSVILDSGLKAGHWRYLTPDEIASLLQVSGLSGQVRQPTARTANHKRAAAKPSKAARKAQRLERSGKRKTRQASAPRESKLPLSDKSSGQPSGAQPWGSRKQSIRRRR
jgi:23S rRNA pseudouridine2605 synthase